jgi:hypothetical protein
MLAKDSLPSGKNSMNDNATISEEYRALQQELHKNPSYGVASFHYAPLIKQVLELTKAQSLSDCGAGKQNLMKALSQLGVKDIEYLPYDPAFPEYDSPKPADLVCCVDVLEHI